MWTAAFCLVVLLFSPQEGPGSPSFQDIIDSATRALEAGHSRDAGKYIHQALERDPNSREAWSLKVRWAKSIKDRDDQVFALHRLLNLAVTQDAPEEEIDEIRAKVFGADPLAEAYFDFKAQFAEQLLPLAEFYETEGLPHAAIRINNAVLALAPERTECQENILRIAALPDPSLADSAQDKDLLANVSEQWIKWFNKKHSDWDERAHLEKENYTTFTNAGYEVLLRTAETMENVNSFYRKFFNYGTPENDKAVPRIHLYIFKSYEDYHNVRRDWSGGVFTGDTIQTYIGAGGFDAMLKTLFHEVAHQFVRLATDASRTLWLNEGLATYFEGSEILANGTVLMNMPSNGRLFELAKRLETGWMKDRHDGIDPGDPRVVPDKAPTMEMVIKCNYEWAPAWYAPVWGVIYFFFNYQDPVDGRFVYRKAFREYIDKYGGRSGGGAINKLEEMVLGRPEKPTPGMVYPEGMDPILTPKKLKELNEAWMDFIVGLRDEQSGKKKVARPYDHWARCAVQRGDLDTAQEHFERGVMEHPDDPELKMDFAKFLAGKRKNHDRASKLMLQAIRILEFQEEGADAKVLEEARAAMADWDPKWNAFMEIHEALSKSSKDLITQYVEADLPMMAMDMSWRLGTKLGVLDILPFYRDGYRKTGKSLWNWKMAYNEKDLTGWLASGSEEVFQPNGRELETNLGEYKEGDFNYQILTMDTVTSGDFSLEAEMYCKAGEVNLCGLLVGKKGTQNCQAVVLFPGKRSGGRAQRGYIDLATFYDDNSFDTHRHTPVKGKFPGWHKVRVDVTGMVVDVWFDDKFVMTHEFPNLSVVRGQFGLLAGTGKAKYRNIRFLSRDPRDPTARIERKVRMESLRAESLTDGGGGSLNGSWLGSVPPWLEHVKWVKEEREDWGEGGPVPTLIVLWSIQQNNQMPIHDFLRYLVSEYGDIGLDMICVASAADEKKIEAYLTSKPFPGSVGVDKFLTKGYGETFELFGVGPNFNLPRLILMDIDGTVVWEGDPGFKIGSDWKEGDISYLDSPLEDLVVRKRLREFYPWYQAWTRGGRRALHEGDLAEAGKLLLKSQLFDGRYHPRAKDAQRLLFGLQIAFGDLESVSERLAKAEGEPALAAFLAWGDQLDLAPDAKVVKSLRPVLRGSNAKAWTNALMYIKKAKRNWRKGKELQEAEKLAKRLDSLEGLFPGILKQELSAALESQDPEAIARLMDQADRIPARWLAQEYFKW
jgi:hypothetical protein